MAAGVDCYEDAIRIIRYAVISVAGFCALVNVIVIAVERQISKTFNNILFTIQLLYCVLCCAILTYYPTLDEVVHCRLIYTTSAGSQAFGQCQTANCLTLVLQTAILRLLNNQVSGLRKTLFYLKLLAFGVGLAIFMLPLLFGSYHQCGAGVGNCHFYCGLCYENQETASAQQRKTDELVLWLNWVLPAFIVVLLGFYFSVKIYRTGKQAAEHNQILTDQQNIYRKVAHIPVITFLLLLINLLTKISSSFFETPSLYALFVAMNMMFYVVPIANLALWVVYTRADLYKLHHFEWLLCRNNNEKLLRSEAYSVRFSNDHIAD